MTETKASNDAELRVAAEKRIRARQDFYMHLAAFLVINGALWAIWALTSGTDSYPWPVWVSLLWGVGFVFHVVELLRRPITEDRIAREVERLRRK